MPPTSAKKRPVSPKKPGTPRGIQSIEIGMQVLNAVLLPIVVSLLVIIAATVLPESARIGGWRLKLTAGLVGLVAVAGLIGALAGLQ